MKIYDFDGMFDEKLSAYISRDPHRYTEEGWEDAIPALYKKFGETVIKSIGKSPRQYYAEMTDAEIAGCLRQHIAKGVSVPGFLRSEAESRSLREEFLKMLGGTPSERDFAMGVLGADDAAIPKYMDILVSCGDEEVKARCAEFISEKADLAAGRAIENYRAGVEKEYMCEILSRTVVKDDRIFEILLNEFRTADEDLDVRADFLANYGDERALPYLLSKADEDGLTYLEFRELKFAVETLGGEYKRERDFSGDPAYRALKEHEESSADIFGIFQGDKNSGGGKA